MRKASETQRALDREFDKLNSKYTSLAKAIMLKDKFYLLGLAQENSKQLTLQQVLRVVECVYREHVPVHRTSTILGINNPITSEATTATSTAAIARNEATTLGIGFAFLLLFVQGKQSLPLAEYMGEAQASILDRASKFVLSPKPIDDNSPGLDKDTRIRIGNLTFSRPPVEVWTSATSVAESLSEIISHITLEQRLSYIKQQNCSSAIMAVQNGECDKHLQPVH